MLATGLGATHWVMAVGMWVLAVLALFTVGQRVVYVHKQMAQAGDA